MMDTVIDTYKKPELLARLEGLSDDDSIIFHSKINVPGDKTYTIAYEADSTSNLGDLWNIFGWMSVVGNNSRTWVSVNGKDVGDIKHA